MRFGKKARSEVKDDGRKTHDLVELAPADLQLFRSQSGSRDTRDQVVCNPRSPSTSKSGVLPILVAKS